MGEFVLGKKSRSSFQKKNDYELFSVEKNPPRFFFSKVHFTENLGGFTEKKTLPYFMCEIYWKSDLNIQIHNVQTKKAG